jgi:putative DNA primase/helicase
VLRFHPRCPWQTESIPCLIAAFTSISDNTVTAIHRIRVDRPDRWPKTERKMLGPTAGAAIKLDPAGRRIAIGEGLESCMAARQLGFKPAWALGSARFAKFAPINGVDELIVLGERDEASRKGADACAQVWMRQGRDVYLSLPRGSGNDFNDYLMEAAG